MLLTRAAGVGLLLGSFGAPAATPKVTLVRSSPVVIAGSGYTAGARFFVDYRSGAVHVRRRVIATVAGRFRIVLRGVTFERCNGLSLTSPGASRRLAPAKTCRNP